MTSILPEHTAKTHSTSPDAYRPLGPRVTPDMLSDEQPRTEQRYRVSWKDRAPLHHRVITAVRALLSGPREAVDQKPAPTTAAWTCPPVPVEDFEAVSWALADNPSSVPGAKPVAASVQITAADGDYEVVGINDDGTAEIVDKPRPRKDGVPYGVEPEAWAATEVCPAWCETAHNDADPSDSHSHCGHNHDVDLSRDEGVSKFGLDYTSITLGMVHHYTDVEPVIQLDHDSIRTWVELSMDEAEELGLTLLTMVKASRQAA